MDYGTVAERRKNYGAGLKQLHEKHGVTDSKFGIGLWCQNRPEWQLTGEITILVCKAQVPNRSPQI